MERRTLAILASAAILIAGAIGAGLLLSRPITGTWVCTDRLTEHAMLSDEVTVIAIHADGTADFRSYATYLIGRYRMKDGNGRWQPAGPGVYRIALESGTESSCSPYENCTIAALPPMQFSLVHDPLADTIAYDLVHRPEFTAIHPFSRSIVPDCSGPAGCP